MRPRTAQSPTPADAWTQTRPFGTRDHPRPRAHAEHSPRPLRTRRRRAHPPANRDRLHRARPHDLTAKTERHLGTPRPDPNQRNSAVETAFTELARTI